MDPEKEKGSYSMKGSGNDCDWGKASRKSANRSHQWVKTPCGRGAKYRCKDGSAKWEENLFILEEYVNDALDEGIDQSQLEAYLSGIISRELSRAVKQHMAKTGCSFNSILRGIQAIADAEKGSPKKEGA